MRSLKRHVSLVYTPSFIPHSLLTGCVINLCYYDNKPGFHSSAKYNNSVIIHPHFVPNLYDFLLNTKYVLKIFLDILKNVNQALVTIDFHFMEKNILCSTEESKPYRFETT